MNEMINLGYDIKVMAVKAFVGRSHEVWLHSSLVA